MRLDINLRLPAYAIPALRMSENIRRVCSANNIRVNPPTVRFAFAPNTAIAINSARMPVSFVQENSAKSIRYLKEFVEFFHPEISPFVRMDVDVPWEKHDDVTKTILAYCGDLLLKSKDASVVEALSKLRQLGINRGGRFGSDQAHEYAAAHSLIFRDALELPVDNFFHGCASKPLFSISIGGRPEKQFNVMRRYIRKNARACDLSSHGTGKCYLDAWNQSLSASRTNYCGAVDCRTVHDGDKPLVSIAAITSIGASPTYYRSEFDLPMNCSARPTVLLKQMAGEIELEKTGQGRALAKERLKTVANDVNALIDDAGGENQLMEFLLAFNRNS